MANDPLKMGIVGRPHGIKGEIGVDWRGDNVPPRNAPIFLRLGMGALRPYKITSSREHKGRLLLALEGIEDRNAAEKLKGAEIFMPRESLPELNADEAYLEDLIGANVYLESGELLGELDHVEFPAGQEIWAIKLENGNEFLFPAREEFIKSFNVDKKSICITPPEGLLDIYRA